MTSPLDVTAIRERFSFPERHRVVTNNAASTQPLHANFSISTVGSCRATRTSTAASPGLVETTALFEESYDTIADFIGSPGPESHRALPQHHRSHQRGHVLAADRVPRRRQRRQHADGTQLELRSVARVVPGDPAAIRAPRRAAGSPASTTRRASSISITSPRLVDARTKLVCCTGASNFLGTKSRWRSSGRIADASGYRQPDGEVGAPCLLIDGAQLVPSNRSTSRQWMSTYLSFSFHKLLAPVRGGSRCMRKEHLLASSLPFLYGGDMVADGQVVAEPRRLQRPAVEVFRGHTEHPRHDHLRAGFAVRCSTWRGCWTADLLRSRQHDRPTGRRDHDGPRSRRTRCDSLTGPSDGWPAFRVYASTVRSIRAARTSLVAFNVPGAVPLRSPSAQPRPASKPAPAATARRSRTVTSGWTPLASCRLSFYLYNTEDDVDRAVDAVRRIAGQN